MSIVQYDSEAKMCSYFPFLYRCVSAVTESGGGIPTSTNEAYGRVGGGRERGGI